MRVAFWNSESRGEKLEALPSSRFSVFFIFFFKFWNSKHGIHIMFLQDVLVYARNFEWEYFDDAFDINREPYLRKWENFNKPVWKRIFLENVCISRILLRFVFRLKGWVYRTGEGKGRRNLWHVGYELWSKLVGEASSICVEEKQRRWWIMDYGLWNNGLWTADEFHCKKLMRFTDSEIEILGE